MTVESLPSFTPPAAKLWRNMPDEARKRLLSNVWCVDCRHSVTITNFTGVVKVGLDVALEALKDAWRQRKLDMNQVTHFARINRVEKVMQPYLETVVA